MPRLKRVTRSDLGIVRQRRGRGYLFVDAEGSPVRDPEFRARVQQLGIPPAWQDVRLSPLSNAHIQACGTDQAGRIQYIYHADWEQRRTRRKQQQLALLTAALPRIRRHVNEDLGAPAGSRQLARAIGVALIDRTAMRVGRERYLDANGTRGAATLYSRDLTVKGDEVRVSFPAKSGKSALYSLKDAQLADAIARIRTIPGRRLLMYRDPDGAPRVLRSDELNSYLRELAGAAITAKDFRTLHGSALAAERLAKLEPKPSPSGRKRQAAEITRQVANFLQNTPAICRKSYIAPCLYALFETGRLGPLWGLAGDGKAGLRQREARLSAVLAEAG